MKADEYQSIARTTALSNIKNNQSYLALGLNGEAGEVAELVKKSIRDKTNEKEYRSNMKKELGDVLWYVAMMAEANGFNLSEIMEANISKLQARKEQGKISGSGSNREE